MSVNGVGLKPGWNKSGPARFNAPKKDRTQMLAAFIAPLGTLAFLVTLWLVIVVGAMVLEESGAKIAAALKGKPARRQAFAPVRMRARPRLQTPMRAAPRWRDAA